ncbi:hypothetical protein CYMTET_18088 [Cymbomonas tetramitiformis]|uniref:Uncharacterized protein n=1 Tax=Cymbomonas tetramitiformis TaxID=36881 RepID=A0AAE0L6A0_9CHLO|nr:hypothetical protein CYMTET_18088 [Cymbomonas tetramitiformis]
MMQSAGTSANICRVSAADSKPLSARRHPLAVTSCQRRPELPRAKSLSISTSTEACKPECVGAEQSGRRAALLSGCGSGLALSAQSASARELVPEDTPENLKLVKKICKLMAKGEYDAVSKLTAEEAKVVKQGPEELPYCGKYFGQRCVKDFYSKFEEYFTITKIPETLFYLGETGAIFAAFDYEYVVAKNCEVMLSTSVAMKIVITDGKLTKMAMIGDTLSEYLTLQKAEVL